MRCRLHSDRVVFAQDAASLSGEAALASQSLTANPSLAWTWTCDRLALPSERNIPARSGAASALAAVSESSPTSLGATRNPRLDLAVSDSHGVSVPDAYH